MGRARTYTERMSRILADAKPASPRVGCVLLRCRLGARGRDVPTKLDLTEPERRRLAGELAVVAGSIVIDTSDPTILIVDPTSTRVLYGGDEAWARCVKGYLNGRGFGASIAIAPTAELALEAARARWGISVVQGVGDAGSAADARNTTSVRIRAVQAPAHPSGATADGRSKPTAHHPASPQLGLPGLKLGRTKRGSRSAGPKADAKGPSRAA